MTKSPTVVAWIALGALALYWPAALHAQGQVCMDGTRASASDGTTCADHGGVDYVATNTGASSLGGTAGDSAPSTICVDGSKTAPSAGLAACPGTENADSAASRTVRNATGQAGEPSKSPKHPKDSGSVGPPPARPVSDTTKFRKDST
jgi:hypothetical protein